MVSLGRPWQVAVRHARRLRPEVVFVATTTAVLEPDTPSRVSVEVPAVVVGATRSGHDRKRANFYETNNTERNNELLHDNKARN